MAALPTDPNPATLLSKSALAETLVAVYAGCIAALAPLSAPPAASADAAAASAAEAAAAVAHRDGVFDALAAHFSAQFAGDGGPCFMPELQEPDGPLGRLLSSCRCAACSADSLVVYPTLELADQLPVACSQCHTATQAASAAASALASPSARSPTHSSNCDAQYANVAAQGAPRRPKSPPLCELCRPRPAVPT